MGRERFELGVDGWLFVGDPGVATPPKDDIGVRPDSPLMGDDDYIMW